MQPTFDICSKNVVIWRIITSIELRLSPFDLAVSSKLSIIYWKDEEQLDALFAIGTYERTVGNLP